MNCLPKTVTRQCHGCDLNPGPSAPESSMLTTRLLSHPSVLYNCLTAVMADGAVTFELRTERFRCQSKVLLFASFACGS